MLTSSRYSRAISAEAGEIGRRLQALEKSLEKIGARASTNGRDTAENLGDAIASALSGWVDRFRQGTGTVGDQSAALGKDAAKLGAVALTRITDQAGRRPVFALAIAVGVGILIGIAMRNSRKDLSK
jgi:ElaB/YqjD/DUF883 family membrane-anchored ribosome-binding protein